MFIKTCSPALETLAFDDSLDNYSLPDLIDALTPLRNLKTLCISNYSKLDDSVSK